MFCFTVYLVLCYFSCVATSIVFSSFGPLVIGRGSVGNEGGRGRGKNCHWDLSDCWFSMAVDPEIQQCVTSWVEISGVGMASSTCVFQVID